MGHSEIRDWMALGQVLPRAVRLVRLPVQLLFHLIFPFTFCILINLSLHRPTSSKVTVKLNDGTRLGVTQCWSVFLFFTTHECKRFQTSAYRLFLGTSRLSSTFRAYSFSSLFTVLLPSCNTGAKCLFGISVLGFIYIMRKRNFSLICLYLA